VLAVRWNEAYGTSDAQPFELGGSNSDDFILLPRLNERQFALRGYTSGEASLTGHRARVVSAELRTPIADLDRHAMTPPVGINRLSFNLFYDLGAAWERGASPDYHRGIGFELIAEPRVIYIAGWRWRAGVAKGLDQGGGTEVYLHAGRSF
jgi:outer membrane protein assembly factor BamA